MKFRRTARPSAAPAGTWAVARATLDGQALIIRFDRSVQPDRSQRDGLPHRIGVTLPFNEQLRPTDHDALAAFEDAIEAQLRAHGARLVIVITSATFREFVLHAPSTEWVEAAHEQLRRSWPRYEIQMYAADDPEWVVYTSLTGAAGSSPPAG